MEAIENLLKSALIHRRRRHVLLFQLLPGMLGNIVKYNPALDGSLPSAY